MFNPLNTKNVELNICTSGRAGRDLNFDITGAVEMSEIDNIVC